MLVLGIESSHDDTAIALVQDNFKVLFNYKISQIELHQKFGGTVPELASREHFNNFYLLLNKIKQNYNLEEIDFISYTAKPGLIGALQMGHLFAHALSKSLNKPLVPINHLDGHIFSSLLWNEKPTKEIKYPALALLVSGGHSIIYLLETPNQKTIIGQTLDDALGEAFDKAARSMKLGFPGGPIIDTIYNNNNFNEVIKLNTPHTDNKYDFSFSGFKTQINNLSNKKNIDINLLAFSFQKQTIDYVIKKFSLAMSEYNPETIILAGGVSANSYLRNQFQNLHPNHLVPPMEFATDNGAMIAAACIVEKSNK